MINQNIPHAADGKANAPSLRKYGRPNALRKAQVMPPHNVELTLAPAANADMCLPADISGRSLVGGRTGAAGVKPPTRAQ